MVKILCCCRCKIHLCVHNTLLHSMGHVSVLRDVRFMLELLNQGRVGWKWGMYGRNEECIQIFLLQPERKKSHWDVGIDGKIILKWNIKVIYDDHLQIWKFNQCCYIWYRRIFCCSLLVYFDQYSLHRKLFYLKL